MTCMLTGEGLTMRTWTFANTQQPVDMLGADVAQDATSRAQDEAILGTFRPDNAIPWSC